MAGSVLRACLLAKLPCKADALIYHSFQRATQLSAVVYFFSRHVHDPTLPLATQTLSVRVTLHLVDSICRHSATDEGAKHWRRLLVWILRTLVTKFGSLRAYLPKLEAQERIRAMEQEVQDQGALRQLLANGTTGTTSSSGGGQRSRPATPAADVTGSSNSSTARAPSPAPSPGGGGGSSSSSGGGNGPSLPRKPSPAVVERVERCVSGLMHWMDW